MGFSERFGDGFLINYFIKTNPFGMVPVEDCEAQGGLRPPPSLLYLSLHTSVPSSDHTFALSCELSGSNYSRISAPTDTTGTPSMWFNLYARAGGREVTNMLGLQWPAATPTAWPPVRGIGLWRTAAGGASRDYIAHLTTVADLNCGVGQAIYLAFGFSPPSDRGGIYWGWANK